jgi:hypothetical protein
MESENFLKKKTKPPPPPPLEVKWSVPKPVKLKTEKEIKIESIKYDKV